MEKRFQINRPGMKSPKQAPATLRGMLADIAGEEFDLIHPHDERDEPAVEITDALRPASRWVKENILQN